MNQKKGRFHRSAILIALTAVSFLTARPAASPMGTPLGEHDFDFNIGSWKTHIKYRRVSPAGAVDWVEMNGTVVVRKIWNGKGELEELEADGPAGHFEGATLFLFNPQSGQWSQTFANSNDGTLTAPLIGDFKSGRGELYAQEAYHGKVVLLRGVWSAIAPNSHQFEEAFSEDGGKTWQPSFIGTLTREK